MEVSIGVDSGMKVLMASAEMAPFAKVGGLADVVGSLPLALRELGADARVVLPAYSMIENGPWKLSPILHRFTVTVNDHWHQEASVRVIDHQGMPVYLIGAEAWFHEASRSESIYRPGIDQYLFFSQAVLQMFRFIGWRPDVVHAHDWHMGFIPLLIKHSPYHRLDDVTSVYTIHNQAYQGEFGPEILSRLNLPEWLYQSEFVEAYGRVNFLKTGAVFADQVTTVSPQYSEDVQTPEYGAQLDGLMRRLAIEDRFSGILNGISQSEFNPESDPHLPTSFSADRLGGKNECRSRLLQEAGLPESDDAPVFGIVSRLSSQKGLDLLLESADRLLDLPAKLIVLGAGEPAITQGLIELQQRRPDRVKFFNGFHETLAPLVYAGCDGFLMPSSFEPCGLGQMIAMRYGTVPIVRKTGGLADTVIDGETGFAFKNRSSDEFLEAVSRFKTLWQQQTKLEAFRKRIMKEDWSWTRGARDYLQLYKQAMHQNLERADNIA